MPIRMSLWRLGTVSVCLCRAGPRSWMRTTGLANDWAWSLWPGL